MRSARIAELMHIVEAQISLGEANVTLQHSIVEQRRAKGYGTSEASTMLTMLKAALEERCAEHRRLHDEMTALQVDC